MHSCPCKPLAVLASLGFIAALVVTPLAAQGAPGDTTNSRRPEIPPDSLAASCLHTIPDSVGTPVTAYLGVAANDSVPLALRDQADNFTVILDEYIRRALHATGDAIPRIGRVAGGSGPTSVDLVIRRSGTFAWAIGDSARSSAFTRRLLVDALDSSRAAHEVITWPDDVPGDSATVRVAVVVPLVVGGRLVGGETLPHALPIFTMRVIAEKPAAVKRLVQPPYPEENRASGWTGTIDMQFVVDTAGHAVESSIKDIWPSNLPRLAADEREVYGRFVRAARNAIENASFYPAEVAGCKVRQVVQQAFVFSFYGQKH